MPLIQLQVHPRGLDFENQKKVILLRDVQRRPDGKKWRFDQIAKKVRNRLGKRSTEGQVRHAYNNFSTKKEHVKYKYHRCGRKVWKLTPVVGKYLIQQLRKVRRKTVCTSTSLQADLYEDMNVHLSDSAIWKHLKKNGYRWRKRSQKRKYSQTMMKTRKKSGSVDSRTGATQPYTRRWPQQWTAWS